MRNRKCFYTDMFIHANLFICRSNKTLSLLPNKSQTLANGNVENTTPVQKVDLSSSSVEITMTVSMTSDARVANTGFTNLL